MSNNFLESRKLKHARLISLTTLYITIIGTAIIASIFNESFNLPFSREPLIIILILVAVFIISSQNKLLGVIEEEILNGTESPARMNQIANFIQDIIVNITDFSIRKFNESNENEIRGKEANFNSYLQRSSDIVVGTFVFLIATTIVYFIGSFQSHLTLWTLVVGTVLVAFVAMLAIYLVMSDKEQVIS